MFALGARLEGRPWHVALGAFAGGLALGGGLGETTSAAVAAAALAGANVARAPRAGMLAAAAIIAGAAVGAVRVEAIDAPGGRLHAGDRVAGLAYLTGPVEPGPFGSSAEVRMHSGSAGGARIVVRFGREQRLPIGAGPGFELALTGSLRLPRVRPDAEFDVRAYYRRRGVAGEVAPLSVRVTGRHRGGMAGFVDRARVRAQRAVAHGLSPPAAALARGMVLGQDELIDDAVRDDFRASGLAHLLAVSGQNVMLLGALAVAVLAGLGAGVRARLVVTVLLIAAYVPLAGAGPSLQRAGVMGAAALIALAVSRPASRWYTLLLAAGATLALNPRSCADPGWQLSFAAVTGILLIAPAIRVWLGGLPRPLAEGVAITVAATLATAPLMGHHFGSVAVAGLPANVAALPLVPLIMWLGVVRAAAGQCGGIAMPLVDLAGLPLGLALDALSDLATAFAGVPGGQLALPLGSRVAVPIAYGVLALALAGVRSGARRFDPAPAAARWRRAPVNTRIALVCAAGAALALAVYRLLAPPSPPSQFTVSFLDVGQGDATLIQAPGDVAVLFDGGPPEGRVAGLLRAAGVRRLSLVVSTHQSRDHHQGLQAVAESVPIGTLMENGDGTSDRSYWRMVRTARQHGARVVAPRQGEVLAVGALRVRVYGPPPRPPGPPPEDPNRRAVAAVVSYGAFDLFLSGDAESEDLAGLDLPPVDAMKVSHHGSADPGLPQLLRRLRPRVAGIEVGKGNTYGHPRAETLAALARAGVKTYRTDRQGTVRLTVGSDGRLAVDPD